MNCMPSLIDGVEFCLRSVRRLVQKVGFHLYYYCYFFSSALDLFCEFV